MKPAPFQYLRPRSVEEALAALAEYAGEAKVLAGGQSLVPMMNFRVVRPDYLIDINGLANLELLVQNDGAAGPELEIGALVRHRVLETSSLVAERLPVLRAAVAHVAHRAVRNRGTFAGSLVHGDPAAELPAVAVLCEAEMRVHCAGAQRWVSAAEFFEAPLCTDVGEDEIVTGARLQLPPPGTGWGFAELARRRGDFAIAGALATVRREAAVARDARVVVFGVGERAERITRAEHLVNGTLPDQAVLAEVEAAVRESVCPEDDQHASADYRRHLAGVLACEVVEQAWARASAHPSSEQSSGPSRPAQQ